METDVYRDIGCRITDRMSQPYVGLCRAYIRMRCL